LYKWQAFERPLAARKEIFLPHRATLKVTRKRVNDFSLY